MHIDLAESIISRGVLGRNRLGIQLFERAFWNEARFEAKFSLKETLLGSAISCDSYYLETVGQKIVANLVF